MIALISKNNMAFAFIAPILLLTSGVFLSVKNTHASECSLQIDNASLSKKPPGSIAQAAYMSVSNPCDKAIVIQGVESEGFKMAHFHETRIEHGVASMKKVESIVVAPKETVSFTPGSMHIMLMKPDGSNSQGTTLKLILENGESISITIKPPA